MTKIGKTLKYAVLFVVGGVVLLCGFDAAYLVWRGIKCEEFCRTVASLPRNELKDFVSRCDALRAQTNSEKMIVLSDTNTLGRFTLVGAPAKLIYIFPTRGVSIYYLQVGRLGARIDWQNSVLTGTPGDTPGGVLYDPQAK